MPHPQTKPAAAHLEELDDGADVAREVEAEDGGEGAEHHPEVVAGEAQLRLEVPDDGQDLLL